MKIYLLKNKGQTLVEWALVLPILLLLIMGLLDLGRAVYYNSVIYSAAREGARYGIVHPCSSSEIISAVNQRAIATPISNINILYDPSLNRCNNSTSPYPEKISVVVTSNFVPVTPFVGGITLSGRSTMRLEW
jgi:Flp pilus assembly protein TadG